MSELLISGREPNPRTPPVRGFYNHPGFRIQYGSLAELRPAMVEDDIAIIDALAKRRTRDTAIRDELSDAGVVLDASNTARARVLDIAARRHPYEEGLVGLLVEVYPIIADETSSVQLHDYPIVSAIASRLNKAKQATVFKEDRAEGLAPKQQEINKQRAVALAAERHPDDPGLVEQVRALYDVLVPATVAVQQTMFDRTYLVSDWDGIGFRGIDLDQVA